MEIEKIIEKIETLIKKYKESAMYFSNYPEYDEVNMTRSLSPEIRRIVEMKIDIIRDLTELL
jgi:hypothetical protein